MTKRQRNATGPYEPQANRSVAASTTDLIGLGGPVRDRLQEDTDFHGATSGPSSRQRNVSSNVSGKSTLIGGAERSAPPLPLPSAFPNACAYNRASPAVLHLRSDELTCFAAESHSSHANAAVLLMHGVWLGDDRKPDEVITEVCTNGVLNAYHNSTKGRRENTDVTEPTTNKPHHLDDEKAVDCLCCAHGGRETSEGLKIQNASFAKDEMKRTVRRSGVQAKALF